MASVALAAAFGCGGKAQTGGGSSSGSSTGGEGGPTPLDGAADAPDSTPAGRHVTIGCPATPPSSTAACTHEGQFCEYGSDFDPRCNTLFFCSGGSWGSPINVGGATCGSIVAPTVGPNPAECPATRAGVTAGQTCTGSSTCAYDASNCTCGHYCRQFPIPLATCNPDAGIVQSCCDVSGPPTWHCFDGPPYCATNRPSVGDPCTHEGDSCAITAAFECGQTTLRCTGGTWQAPFESCPVSTARAKRDISYLGPDDVLRLRDALLGVKLATYKYKLGDPTEHLGFIIEDTPAGSPAVLASRERVDLYGYVSMAVAAIQQQQRQIHLLEQRLERVEHGRCKEP
jgi:hypothetical protein